MNDSHLMIIIFAMLLMIGYLMINKGEKFGLGPVSSSAFSWNVATGYEQGAPESGYSMFGSWPGELSQRPWTWWQWERRPLIFKTPRSLAPQIDYNYAPPKSNPITNFDIALQKGPNGVVNFSINGETAPTLELDRNVLYYLHVSTPGMPFMITADGQTPLFEPFEAGNANVMFTDDDPRILMYTTPGDPAVGGTIFLNNLKST